MIQAGRRAKTILATSTHVEIGVLDRRVLLRRHALGIGGTVLLSLADIPPRCVERLTADPSRAGGPQLDLVATDVTSVRRPDRIRGIVRMTGRLEVYDRPLSAELATHLSVDGHPGRARTRRVGRFVPGQIDLEWRVETTDARPTHVAIDTDVFGAARVDPLGGWEDGWVAHLDTHHRESIRNLVERFIPLTAGVSARPVLADELGLVVRLGEGRCVRDVRLPFGRIVGCGCEAVEALNTLVTV